MKDFTLDLKKLEAIRKRIGAKLTNNEFKGAGLPPMDAAVDKELRKGIEVNNLDEIETQDGLFVHKGRQIVIYINDHNYKGRESVMQDPNNGNKVHLYECETIAEMKADGRFGRYIKIMPEDNTYPIDDKRGRGIEVKLYPCRKCLRALDYKRFRTSPVYPATKFLDAFDVEEFFGEYSTFFITKPEHSNITVPYTGYSKGWHKIAREFKERNGWICGDCGVNLSQNKYHEIIHAHHIDGVKYDERDKNLKCLCIVCHAKQPRHGHMKHNADKYESLIRKLRREQGLD